MVNSQKIGLSAGVNDRPRRTASAVGRFVRSSHSKTTHATSNRPKMAFRRVVLAVSLWWAHHELARADPQGGVVEHAPLAGAGPEILCLEPRVHRSRRHDSGVQFAQAPKSSHSVASGWGDGDELLRTERHAADESVAAVCSPTNSRGSSAIFRRGPRCARTRSAAGPAGSGSSRSDRRRTIAILSRALRRSNRRPFWKDQAMRARRPISRRRSSRAWAAATRG